MAVVNGLVVELEEGLRVVSALRGIAPDRLALDLPVAVKFAPVSVGRQDR